MFRLIHRVLLVAGVTGVIALSTRPYHDGILRYGLPLAMIATWTAVLVHAWSKRFWRFTLLLLPAALAVPFCLPEREIDRENLRDRYVAAMERLVGTRYVWGEESSRGIDCSGLPRRAMRDALLEVGLENGNGLAFQKWAELWWFDTSAKALGENHRGFTRPAGIHGKLRDLNHDFLMPGDLAVTGDGRHVMVYLRGGNWIQSDPVEAKVITRHKNCNQMGWFDSLVTVHRWTLFD